MNNDTSRPVIFFDGVCNLCNRTIQLIIKYDRRQRFLFAPLQSAAGKAALAAAGSPGNDTGSVILYYNGRYHTRSAAALNTFKLLGGAWPLLYAFIIVPPFIRNTIYNQIARNRYKWFGQRSACMVPTPELAARFLS
jgi:predicted DCC family thiol-disulfide oxidoreductase YuxK